MNKDVKELSKLIEIEVKRITKEYEIKVRELTKIINQKEKRAMAMLDQYKGVPAKIKKLELIIQKNSEQLKKANTNFKVQGKTISKLEVQLAKKK